jgi:hypothetical protein
MLAYASALAAIAAVAASLYALATALKALNAADLARHDAAAAQSRIDYARTIAEQRRDV